MFFTLTLVWFFFSLVGVVASYLVDGFVSGVVISLQTLVVFAFLLAAFGA